MDLEKELAQEQALRLKDGTQRCQVVTVMISSRVLIAGVRRWQKAEMLDSSSTRHKAFGKSSYRVIPHPARSIKRENRT